MLAKCIVFMRDASSPYRNEPSKIPDHYLQSQCEFYNAIEGESLVMKALLNKYERPPVHRTSPMSQFTVALSGIFKIQTSEASGVPSSLFDHSSIFSTHGTESLVSVDDDGPRLSPNLKHW